MRIVHFVAALFLVKLSTEDIIRASYGKDVLLTANHTKYIPDSVQWYYLKEGGNRESVLFQIGEFIIPGDNYIGRVELDYITAYLTISNLTCSDNETYLCEVAAPPINAANHTLLLGMCTLLIRTLLLST